MNSPHPNIDKLAAMIGRCRNKDKVEKSLLEFIKESTCGVVVTAQLPQRLKTKG